VAKQHAQRDTQPVTELRDYYEILEVDPTADREAIRASYRLLARRYHPDRPDGSAPRMVLLNEAWTVLSDRGRRARFDRRGSVLIGMHAPKRPELPAVRAQASVTGRTEVRSGLGPIGRRRMTEDPSSSTLGHGRYAGQSLCQVAALDPGYLRWLAGVPAGRSLAREIKHILGE
jgi:curved DNA-binding protein CbpA